MKSFIKVIFSIYMILLIPFMIYIYYTNHSLSSAMQNNDALRSKIEALDEFKVSIIDMAVMSKYYLITGDEEYNIEFENSYDTASDKIESLYESQYISQSEKDEFIQSLNYYKESAQSYASNSYSQNIDPDFKKQIRNLSEIETDMIKDTSKVLYSSLQTAKDNSGYAINLVDNQNNLLEVLGGFFTMVFLCPIYFISRNSSAITGVIKTFISEHFSKKSKSQTPEKSQYECDEKMLQCINESIVRNFQEKINERNLLVSTLRIIYSHSEYMEKEWEEGRNILDSVEKDLSDLRNELDSLLNKSHIPYERFNIIENKLLEVKFLLEKLPGYHDFIMKLTKPYSTDDFI